MGHGAEIPRIIAMFDAAGGVPSALLLAAEPVLRGTHFQARVPHAVKAQALPEIIDRVPEPLDREIG